MDNLDIYLQIEKEYKTPPEKIVWFSTLDSIWNNRHRHSNLNYKFFKLIE